MIIKRNGFTLIELSIVLVIIALVIGGIFTGKSLLRSAKLQSVSKEVAQYRQAISEFRDKYNGFPGDLYNAQSIWGTDTGCPNSTYTTTPHKETCNGNGDGRIAALDGATYYCNRAAESWRAWQQLASAGLITGAYSGTQAVNSNICYDTALGVAVGITSRIGVNVPRSALSNAGYTLAYVTATPTDTQFWPINGHILAFGAEGFTRAGLVVDQWTFGQVLTPTEAFNIDSKTDDGLPAFGKVMGLKAYDWPNCATSDTASLANYKTTYNGNDGCGLVFVLGL